MIEGQTQCHRTLRQHHAILHHKNVGMHHLFNSANKEIFSVLSVPVIKWQEATVIVKKRSFTSIC
jgi:hypothetical protein